MRKKVPGVKPSSKPSRRRKLNTEKRKKREKIILSIMIPIMVLILGISVYGAKLLATANQTAQQSYHEIEHNRAADVNPIEDPVSFLLIGVDDNEDRNLGSSRADSLIYATFNPKTGAVNTVSIPRDTYTGIIKDETLLEYNRINTSYTAGEEQATIETVENLLQNPIHYYATFDFDAFMDIIDALGGIEVNVPITFSEQDSTGKPNQIHLEKGWQTLNSEEALALARTRKIDNDIKRGERQQLIIEAIIKKALSFGSIPQYTNVIEAVGNNLRTNMELKDMFAVIRAGMKNSLTIQTHTFEWQPLTRYGASMVQLDEASLADIQSTFRQSLNSQSQLVEETPKEEAE